MKRILFIVQVPPPVHGVSIMNLHAVNNPILAKKYKTRVLPLHFGQKLDDIGAITFRKLFYMTVFSVKLFYILLLYKPDLVYFTIMPTGKVFYRDAFFTRIIKLFRPKIIMHLHGKGIKETAENSITFKRLYVHTFKGVSLISLSNSLRNDLSDVYENEPFILPNGIEELISIHKKNENEVPVLIFLSNLIINKGIQVFLNSLVELNKQNIPFRACIVGGSYDYSIEEAKEFCKVHGLSDKVEVKGPKFGKEKTNELLQADIFVLPSFNECFPLAILEAMQIGLPVVATKVGGIPDLIADGEDGLLVNVNDSKDLYEKLRLLLNDDNYRKRLGQKAQEKFYLNFTINHFNEGLAKIIDKVFNS